MIYNFLFCSQAKHVFNLSPNKSFDDVNVKKLKLIAFLVNQVDKQSRTTKNYTLFQKSIFCPKNSGFLT